MIDNYYKPVKRSSINGKDLKNDQTLPIQKLKSRIHKPIPEGDESGSSDESNALTKSDNESSSDSDMSSQLRHENEFGTSQSTEEVLHRHHGAKVKAEACLIQKNYFSGGLKLGNNIDDVLNPKSIQGNDHVPAVKAIIAEVVKEYKIIYSSKKTKTSTSERSKSYDKSVLNAPVDENLEFNIRLLKNKRNKVAIFDRRYRKNGRYLPHFYQRDIANNTTNIKNLGVNSSGATPVFGTHHNKVVTNKHDTIIKDNRPVSPSNHENLIHSKPKTSSDKIDHSFDKPHSQSKLQSTLNTSSNNNLPISSPNKCNSKSPISFRGPLNSPKLDDFISCYSQSSARSPRSPTNNSIASPSHSDVKSPVTISPSPHSPSSARPSHQSPRISTSSRNSLSFKSPYQLQSTSTLISPMQISPNIPNSGFKEPTASFAHEAIGKFRSIHSDELDADSDSYFNYNDFEFCSEAGEQYSDFSTLGLMIGDVDLNHTRTNTDDIRLGMGYTNMNTDSFQNEFKDFDVYEDDDSANYIYNEVLVSERYEMPNFTPYASSSSQHSSQLSNSIVDSLNFVTSITTTTASANYENCGKHPFDTAILSSPSGHAVNEIKTATGHRIPVSIRHFYREIEELYDFTETDEEIHVDPKNVIEHDVSPFQQYPQENEISSNVAEDQRNISSHKINKKISFSTEPLESMTSSPVLQQGRESSMKSAGTVTIGIPTNAPAITSTRISRISTTTFEKGPLGKMPSNRTVLPPDTGSAKVLKQSSNHQIMPQSSNSRDLTRPAARLNKSQQEVQVKGLQSVGESKDSSNSSAATSTDTNSFQSLESHTNAKKIKSKQEIMRKYSNSINFRLIRRRSSLRGPKLDSAEANLRYSRNMKMSGSIRTCELKSTGHSSLDSKAHVAGIEAPNGHLPTHPTPFVPFSRPTLNMATFSKFIEGVNRNAAERMKTTANGIFENNKTGTNDVINVDGSETFEDNDDNEVLTRDDFKFRTSNPKNSLSSDRAGHGRLLADNQQKHVLSISNQYMKFGNRAALNKVMENFIQQSAANLSDDDRTLVSEMTQIYYGFNLLDRDKDSFITVSDLQDYFKTYMYSNAIPVSVEDIEYLIWSLDDSLKKSLTFEDVKNYYLRVRYQLTFWRGFQAASSSSPPFSSSVSHSQNPESGDHRYQQQQRKLNVTSKKDSENKVVEKKNTKNINKIVTRDSSAVTTSSGAWGCGFKMRHKSLNCITVSLPEHRKPMRPSTAKNSSSCVNNNVSDVQLKKLNSLIPGADLGFTMSALCDNITEPLNFFRIVMFAWLHDDKGDLHMLTAYQTLVEMFGPVIGEQRFEQLFSRSSSSLVDSDRVTLSNYISAIQILETQAGRRILCARERAEEYLRKKVAVSVVTGSHSTT